MQKSDLCIAKQKREKRYTDQINTISTKHKGE
jgi:hypothetical protein